MAIDIDLRKQVIEAKVEETKKVAPTAEVLDRNYRVISIDLDTTFNDYPVLSSNGLYGIVVKKIDVLQCDSNGVMIKINQQIKDAIPINIGDYIHGFEIHEIYVTNTQAVPGGKLILLLRW